MSEGKKLPAGWEVKRLGDVLLKTETINPLTRPTDRFKYIDVSSVNNKTFRIEDTTIISGSDAPSRARKLVQHGDVIFATIRPTLKRIAIVPKEYDNQICSTGYFVLKGNSLIENKLLFYFLQTEEFISNMEKMQKGASYPAVTDRDVRRQLINLPPLVEQKKLIAILDESFTAIDKAKESAERNLANARDLFEGYLNQIFSNPGEGWEERRLADVCIVERGSSPRPIKEYFTLKADGVNWIKIRDTEEGGKYVYSTAQKITKEGAEQSRYVKEGDFILTNSMSLGRPYIMKTDGYIHDGWFVLGMIRTHHLHYSKDILYTFFY